MGLRERLSIWASRDNYDDVMEYLSVDETKHAPVFDYEHAPEDLRDLIDHAFMPEVPNARNGSLNFQRRRGRSLMAKPKCCWRKTI